MYYIRGATVKTTTDTSGEFVIVREELIEAYDEHCKAFTVVPSHKLHLLVAYRQAIVRNSQQGGDLFTLGELSAIKSLIHKDLGLE